jgi:hypothetical protein
MLQPRQHAGSASLEPEQTLRVKPVSLYFSRRKSRLTRLPDNEIQINVANRDYHYLSRFEIAGAKRISQHLSNFPPRTDPRMTSGLPTTRPRTDLVAFPTKAQLVFAESHAAAIKHTVIRVEKTMGW